MLLKTIKVKLKYLLDVFQKQHFLHIYNLNILGFEATTIFI